MTADTERVTKRYPHELQFCFLSANSKMQQRDACSQYRKKGKESSSGRLLGPQPATRRSLITLRGA